MFDINQFAIKPTADIQLKHPVTGKPLKDGKDAVTVTVMSKANPAYRKAAVAYVEAIRTEGVTDEQREQAANVFLQSAVVGFNNINATVENLADPQFLWLREQIDAAIGDIGNFLPK